MSKIQRKHELRKQNRITANLNKSQEGTSSADKAIYN